ncbi:glutamic acid-rich protein-like [Microplitis mediator]|uniref:glutamic acid-rich protein-like n=1 Tax=Microplitis mediator TaxID=375433 RepID=UPI002554B4C4|nr:glutamic acid-rich protein-like [Microplitis mediator]
MRTQDTVFTGNPFWLLLRRRFHEESLRKIYWISCAKTPLNHVNCFPAINVLASIPRCLGPDNQRGNFIRLNTSRPRIEEQRSPVASSTNTLQVPGTSRQMGASDEMAGQNEELRQKESELARIRQDLDNLKQKLARKEEEEAQRREREEATHRELEKARCKEREMNKKIEELTRQTKELIRRIEELTHQREEQARETPPRAQPVMIDLTTPPVIVKKEVESPAPEDENDEEIDEESHEGSINIEDTLVGMSEDEADDNDEDDEQGNNDEGDNADEDKSRVSDVKDDSSEEEEDDDKDAEGEGEEDDDEDAEEEGEEDDDGDAEEEGKEDDDGDAEEESEEDDDGDAEEEGDEESEDDEDDNGESDDADPDPSTPSPGPSRVFKSKRRAGKRPSRCSGLHTPRRPRKKYAKITSGKRRIEFFKELHLDKVESGQIWFGKKAYKVDNPDRLKNTDWENEIEPLPNRREGRCKTCNKEMSPRKIVDHVWAKHLKETLSCPICNTGNFKYVWAIKKHQKRDNCRPK